MRHDLADLILRLTVRAVGHTCEIVCTARSWQGAGCGKGEGVCCCAHLGLRDEEHHKQHRNHHKSRVEHKGAPAHGAQRAQEGLPDDEGHLHGIVHIGKQCEVSGFTALAMGVTAAQEPASVHSATPFANSEGNKHYAAALGCKTLAAPSMLPAGCTSIRGSIFTLEFLVKAHQEIECSGKALAHRPRLQGLHL